MGQIELGIQYSGITRYHGVDFSVEQEAGWRKQKLV